MVDVMANATTGHHLLRNSAALRRHSTNASEAKPSLKTEVPREKKMSNNKVVQGSEDARRDQTNLDSRYGEIGISAVAAALRFKCENKNPAYAPVAPQPDKRLAETEA
jgi:hypothetical protein